MLPSKSHPIEAVNYVDRFMYWILLWIRLQICIISTEPAPRKILSVKIGKKLVFRSFSIEMDKLPSFFSSFGNKIGREIFLTILFRWNIRSNNCFDFFIVLMNIANDQNYGRMFKFQFMNNAIWTLSKALFSYKLIGCHQIAAENFSITNYVPKIIIIISLIHVFDKISRFSINMWSKCLMTHPYDSRELIHSCNCDART